MTNSFNILINKRSGTVLTMGEAAIEAAIAHSQIPVKEQIFAEPEDMQAELERLTARPEYLLIGGGDGTIRESAHYLATHKKAFGILPFGTMNLLATDLGLTSLQQALTAYAEGVTETTMDAGYVNGEIFLCCASIGTMPKASVFREKNRGENPFLLFPKMFLFVFNSLDKHKKQRVVLKVGNEMLKFHTAALVVADNRFADSDKLTDSNFKRDDLNGGELAAYIATTKTRSSHLRFMARLVFGHWLKDPDLTEVTGKTMTLWTRRKYELVSIDGEVQKMHTPLDFKLKAKFVHLLVPEAAT